MEYADPETLLKQVDELRGLVLANREDADRLRRLPDPIAQALVDRDFYRVLLPRDFGGLGADPVTYWRMVHAAESSAQAVALLYRAAGGSSLYERCPLERCFRDVNAALGHITLGRGMLEDAGRVRLGLRPLSPLF